MSEKNQIKETLNYFFTGFDKLDPLLVKKAFINEAFLMNLDKENHLQLISLNDWLDKLSLIKSNPNHPFTKEQSKKKILYINITGNAANAKVLYKFSKFQFTDYYNLLKIDGSWYIVNKIWHTEMFQ